jgi:curved DNA-binding protein CbpA
LAEASSWRNGAAFSAQCAVLGLRSVRTVDELTAAYRPLILQWHPDRHHGQATHAVAVERATAINDAYAFLLAALERDGLGEHAPAEAPPAARATSPAASRDGFPDASVLEIFVKPSNIISVGYNSATEDLFVKYVGHRIYRYRGVPPAVVEALLKAPSASAFVSAEIDRRYESDALKRTT